MLIAGGYVTDNCNDKNELDKVVDSVDLQVRKIDDICADTGYLNEKLILDIEDKTDTIVYCAVGKQQHYKTLDDLFGDNEPAPPNQEASFYVKPKKSKTVFRFTDHRLS